MKKFFAVLILFATLAISAKAQAENCGDCGQCWVVFFRCVQDSQCPGSKFCTWIIQSEFCGSWDTRGCYPQPLGLNIAAKTILTAFVPDSLLQLHEKAWGLHGFKGHPTCPVNRRKV